jgi:hypothetical protein
MGLAILAKEGHPLQRVCPTAHSIGKERQFTIASIDISFLPILLLPKALSELLAL